MAPPNQISKKDLDTLGRIPLVQPSNAEEVMRRKWEKGKRAREKKRAPAKSEEAKEANLSAQEDAERTAIMAMTMDKRKRAGKLGWITRKFKVLKAEREERPFAKRKRDERIESDGDDDSERSELVKSTQKRKKRATVQKPAPNLIAHGESEPVFKPAAMEAGVTHVAPKPGPEKTTEKQQAVVNGAAAMKKKRKLASPSASPRIASSRARKLTAKDVKNVGDHANRLADLILAIQNDHVAAYEPVLAYMTRALGILNDIEGDIEPEKPAEVNNMLSNATTKPTGSSDAARELNGDGADLRTWLDQNAESVAADGRGDAVGNEDADIREFVMNQSDESP